jgi:hypothetical protein
VSFVLWLIVVEVVRGVVGALLFFGALVAW